ncbi:hypothetical protein F2Q68_00039721 [Brassica cretica]|uniref:Uncharacterized protein n=1 Tax=Brassica cretica TaxID=69181 RepID=A0A8S9MKK9_BRACR|nr:hypothetical protein F2Q68_00039721 [Brassica cretica]
MAREEKSTENSRDFPLSSDDEDLTWWRFDVVSVMSTKTRLETLSGSLRPTYWKVNLWLGLMGYVLLMMFWMSLSSVSVKGSNG